MSRCELSGKGPVVVNLVSHSNIKTKSRSQPNVQKKKLFSQALGEFVTLNVATSTIRNIDHKGGLDSYVLKQPTDKLSKRALAVRKKIQSKLNRKPKKSS